MAKIYARKVKSGEISISDVPAKWRAEVEVILNS